jgi:hypothetical protein
MNALGKIAFTALFGASALTLASTAASARIVCNAEGDCWHSKVDYNYRPEFGVTIHPDNWKWQEGERHAWREHDGRGYWQGGSWKEFE